MIKELENLSQEERDLLFKAPVLVSVLASCSYNQVNQAKKADAIKLAQLKTFTANPALLPYYNQVEKSFKSQFEEAVEKYFPFDDAKRYAIQEELKKINLITNKLDKKYAELIRTSFDRFVNHVKKANHSVFQDFIFPIPIKGLSV